MVEVNYSLISDEFFVNYIKFLTNKLFKILPIYEQAPSTLPNYLESLLVEVSGSHSIAHKIKYDANFLSLMAIIQYLIDNKYSHSVCKREVFKAIEIVEKLQDKYTQKEV